jgi:hypothetical protein
MVGSAQNTFDETVYLTKIVFNSDYFPTIFDKMA